LVENVAQKTLHSAITEPGIVLASKLVFKGACKLLRAASLQRDGSRYTSQNLDRTNAIGRKLVILPQIQ